MSFYFCSIVNSLYKLKHYQGMKGYNETSI